MNDLPDYGLWQLVIINSVIFLIFVFSFFKPQTRRDWRTFGTFAAFIIALFAEMYGFPLTIYLLSGWLVSRFPEVDWFSHNSSHLLQTLLGYQGNAHFGPLHTISSILILGGLALLAVSWKVLFRAQRDFTIARTGPYARLRHPQIPTLIMFPVLVIVYSRLARREEREAFERFGELYAQYAQNVPRFIPRIEWAN
jgi:protein-S-isoprenylcysteine O-methyltransferase Ste14